eukprot:8759760-Ditylum_brightwellii.AAC.1
MPAPHNHAEWLEKVKACAEFHKKKKEEKEASKLTPKPTTSGPKLTLMDNIKTVLCTNCGMSNQQVQEM